MLSVFESLPYTMHMHLDTGSYHIRFDFK
jgi:hypothetical protein